MPRNFSSASSDKTRVRLKPDTTGIDRCGPGSSPRAATPRSHDDTKNARRMQLERAFFVDSCARQVTVVGSSGESGGLMDLLQFVRGCTFDDFLLTPQLGVVPSRDPSVIDLSTPFSRGLVLRRPLV